jgi:hypothetical protein
MKKHILLLLLIIPFSLTLFSQPSDSLMSQRSKFYEKYLELSIPGKELHVKEYKSMVDVLKKIIVVDTRIIDSYAQSGVKIKELEKEISSLNTENNDLSRKISSVMATMLTIYIAGGALVLICIFLLIMLIINGRKISTLKGKLNQ